jgi:hypothetical protein
MPLLWYNCIHGCMFCILIFNSVNYVFFLLCIIYYVLLLCLCIIVMCVPFWVFCVLVLCCVLLVCKCVLYYCYRVLTHLQLNISYIILVPRLALWSSPSEACLSQSVNSPTFFFCNQKFRYCFHNPPLVPPCHMNPIHVLCPIWYPS